MAQAALISNRTGRAEGASVARLSVTGGITSLAVFVACWLGAQARIQSRARLHQPLHDCRSRLGSGVVGRRPLVSRLRSLHRRPLWPGLQSHRSTRATVTQI